ncbi:sugar efflux transporter [Dactylosporangium sp. AC04546]|uniref:sugar efflux transporter n=1 Tax=Dactylosporangium sp. AC04546 TaxID=2862460 RepID=UPI001EE0BD6E|nr:sugar efflux transporter [Dactylosporangium sp. AC04546]WVK89259.1 sugar efflux transporter [Dactylosporangium sp. AC04546]
MIQAPPARHIGVTLLPLGLVFLVVGVSTALAFPFLALFLSTEVRANPVQVTAFLIVSPLAGVLVSSAVARLSDRRAVRRGLLVAAAVAGAAGALTSAFVRDYWVLLGLAVTAWAAAGTLFPQTFAYAREILLRDAPGRAAMGISTLRTVFSVAWVGGPPLGAVLLQAGGFELVYGVAAAAYLVAVAVAALWLKPSVPLADDAGPAAVGEGGSTDVVAEAAPRWKLFALGAAFTLLQCPLTLGAQALPLFTSGDLGGEVSDAGLLLGLCAALEIPFMLLFGWLSTRVPLRSLIVAGAAFGVTYYGIATAAGAIWVLLVAQVVNALFIAAVTGLGISFMQDLLPNEPGRATTLFTNTFPIGAMLAGPLFGVAQQFGFRLAFGMSTALCACGLLVLLAVRHRRAPQPAEVVATAPA